jgi:DNA (cytosine-5)-methyltransferase 1
MRRLRVAELFAGVGGFRVGFDRANRRLGRAVFEVVYSNQWEPSTKRQHASEVYVARFGPEGHSNVDISCVRPTDIPEVDLVVGGFPCQDYSVATTLPRSGGLAGKKGILWWEIHRLLRDKKPRPAYVFLENVDRLLKSPAKQRGRDFAVMLASLADLDYVVEWRTVNAADYGMPQRRRRVFVLAYLKSTPIAEALQETAPKRWIGASGVLAAAFPVSNIVQGTRHHVHVDGALAGISNSFNASGRASPFRDTGVLVNHDVWTCQTLPAATEKTPLREVLVPECEVPAEYYIDELEPWLKLKGAKSLERRSRETGHTYRYSEGALRFPDPLDEPSRTIITAEGGRSPRRFKHVVEVNGRYRRLVPEELERLNMFEPGHTAGVLAGRRAFLMGQALVTGTVERVGLALAQMTASVQMHHHHESRHGCVALDSLDD